MRARDQPSPMRNIPITWNALGDSAPHLSPPIGEGIVRMTAVAQDSKQIQNVIQRLVC
jgi:hypothetical protein